MIPAKESPGINPWRRVTVFFILLIALATVFNTARDADILNQLPLQERTWVNWGLSALWFLLGFWLIRYMSQAIAHISTRRGHYDSRATLLVQRTLSAVGYVFVLVVGLHLLHVKVGSILVGGAVTGVIVGIGAQSTLSNFFAGVILFTLRPFSVGQTITARTYLFGGIEYSGVVVDINWYHTVLSDGIHKRIVPNSSVIVSAITLVSETTTRIYVVPLPYSVSLLVFEEDVRRATSSQAYVTLREFCDTYYAAEVHLPISVGPDVLRDLIHKHQISQ